jgi:hypothetical protein
MQKRSSVARGAQLWRFGNLPLRWKLPFGEAQRLLLLLLALIAIAIDLDVTS